MTYDSKKYCGELYQEYKNLAEKTRIFAQTYTSGKTSEAQAHQDDLLKKEEIRKKLLEQCKDFLEGEISAGELFEIENG